jgi:CheY-like chemotaxis protein
MGGKINVRSVFGKGSIFVVQIPQKISQMVNPNQVKQDSIASTKEWNEKQIVISPQSKEILVPSSENETIDFSNKKILIVDDNKLNIKVARRAFGGFDFQIDECYDGQECLDKVVNGNEYDLILMDIMMPNMGGETALAKLKENPNFKIPTIALTADAIAGAKEKYLSEGFIDYLAKPFSKAQIKEKLDIVFGNNVNSKGKSE